MTVHDLAFLHLPDCYPEGVAAELDCRIKDSATRSALFLCDSEHTRDDLLDAYTIAEERCRVIPLGVSERFSPDASSETVDSTLAELGVESPYVLHVGAIVPRKDVPTLLEAYGGVRARGFEPSLLLVGDLATAWLSDYPKVCAWLAENPELASSVHVLDHVAEHHIPNLFRGAAAYVTTSRWEGFGLTVLEALATGRPVVASAAGSIPEIAQETVWYANPGDAESFAEALACVLTGGREVERRRELGVALASRFSWEATARETLKAYADASDLEV